MTRVAVSGTHGVGKSTLLRAVQDDLGGRVAVVGNVMRALTAEGLPVGPNTVPATLAAYLKRQRDQERAVPPGVHLLSDRVLADGLAYILTALDEGVAKHPWSEGELVVLEAAARLHASLFDYHVVVPVEFPLAGSDPLHQYGIPFQRAVDARLRDLLARDWLVPVIEVRGTVDARAAFLSSLLDPDRSGALPE